MTDNSELTGIVQSVKSYCIGMATGGEFNYDKYELERQKIVSYPELKHILPDWFIECRFGSQYWNFIKLKFSTYQDRRTFLRREFDEIIENIQKGSAKSALISINKSLLVLENESLNKLWKKIIERSESDVDGSITASRSLLESVMKFVLDKERVTYSNHDDLDDLYKKVKISLDLDPAKHNVETFKKIFSGITAVVQGLGNLRNDYGDAHGIGEASFIPQKRHAEFVINLTGALCAFIIDTYNSKIKE